MGPPKLLAQAEELLRTGRADEALSVATSYLARLQRDGLRTLPALNLLGEINLELGNADKARSYFLAAAHADPDGSIPEAQGGGAEKFLWLAQLSNEGGQDSVDWFERGATVLRNEIAAIGDGEGGKDKRKKLSEALCGIIEVRVHVHGENLAQFAPVHLASIAEAHAGHLASTSHSQTPARSHSSRR